MSTRAGLWTGRRELLAGGLAALLTPAALAQAATIDGAERKIAVNRAAGLLRQRFVNVETGERAAARIEAALAAGAYEALNERDAFAARLTAEIYDTTRDKHLVVRAPGSPPADTPAGPPPISDGGIVRVDRLPGGAGYLELIGFQSPAQFRPAIERAMALVAQTPALIIDLRNNRGGAAPSVMYFTSFFVHGAQRIKLMTYRQRITGTTEVRVQEAFSEPTPTSYLNKPVRLLTSARTFSAGEGFTYQLQVRKIALTVGETTGGGANPGGGQPISSQLAMFVPTSSTVHPITGTNWEGVGIKPDFPALPSEALNVALRSLGQKVDTKGVDELSEATLFKAGSAP